MALNFDHPDQETAERLLKAFPGYYDGFVRCQPGNLLMPVFFQKDWQTYANFQFRPDDTLVLSFPKSGTTWTQEMVWLIANDCDFEAAKLILRERFPFLEDRAIGTEKSLKQWDDMAKGDDPSEIIIQPNFIESLPSPRFIKSHLPFTCLSVNLEEKCKIVYVARNPKDVCVSWYHHHLIDPIMETTLNFLEFAEFFKRDEVLYAPYWTNLIEAWNKRHQPNFLFLFYEDLKTDLPGQIAKVASFLGKDISAEQTDKLTEHLGFENFKSNPSVNAQELQEMGYFKKEGSFIRKGLIGDWKNYFNNEASIQFDKWIEEKTLNTDLKFPAYSL